MKILCVDDESSARELYDFGLRRKLPDDELVICASGEDAIDQIPKTNFDVIITDLMMPGLSGIDVLQFAAKRSPLTEVVVITGGATVDTAVEAMRDGARDYIEKPISIPLLVEKIENIRDYQNRAMEAEDYRMAKETTEQEADRQVHLLEKRLQTMQEAINKALGKIRDRSETDASPQACLTEVAELLEPYNWED